VQKLPDKIMVWFGQWPLTWAGTWATTRYPEDAEEYVPAARLAKVEAAARLGLEMAEANDLFNTAETIREALEQTGE